MIGVDVVKHDTSGGFFGSFRHLNTARGTQQQFGAYGALQMMHLWLDLV